MEQPILTTEQRLFLALTLLKRLNWHEHSIEGCKPSEIRVLFCIRKNNDVPGTELKVSEISKRLHVTSPTITQLLNGLEANGLIERHVDAGDRRVVAVALTETGEQVAQRAEHAFFGAMHELVEYLGEEQSKQLIELLYQIFRFFNEKETALSHAQWTGDVYA